MAAAGWWLARPVPVLCMLSPGLQWPRTNKQDKRLSSSSPSCITSSSPAHLLRLLSPLYLPLICLLHCCSCFGTEVSPHTYSHPNQLWGTLPSPQRPLWQAEPRLSSGALLLSVLVVLTPRAPPGCRGRELPVGWRRAPRASGSSSLTCAGAQGVVFLGLLQSSVVDSEDGLDPAASSLGEGRYLSVQQLFLARTGSFWKGRPWGSLLQAPRGLAAGRHS